MIASLPTGGMPLREAFLGLPEDPLYPFDEDDLVTQLLREGITNSEAQSMIFVLKRAGKATVETESRRVVVELTPAGWKMTVFK